MLQASPGSRKPHTPGTGERDDSSKLTAFVDALIIRTDGPIKAPVITLHGESVNVCHLVEKHLRDEVGLVGDKFWRIVKAQHVPALEYWRPRVNGVQLKALQGVRLPDTDQEWERLGAAVQQLSGCLRRDSSPEAFVADLKKLVAECETWWENRTKREGGAGAKRSNSNIPSYPGVKRQAFGYLPAGYSAGGLAMPDLLSPQHLQTPLRDLAALATGSGEGNDLGGTPEGLSGFAGLPMGLGHFPPISLPLATSLPGGFQDVLSADAAAQAIMGAASQASFPTPDMQMVVAHMNQMGSGAPQLNQQLAAAAASLQQQQRQQQQHHQQHQQLPLMTQTPPQQSQQQQQQQQQQAGLLQQQQQMRLVTLNVGGLRFVTTASTLAAAPEGSFLWKLVSVQQPHAPLPGTEREFFIDRNGKMFEHVMEYLRAVRFGEGNISLPTTKPDLQALQREALFYALPGLVDEVDAAIAAFGSLAQLQFDSVYVETGYHDVNHVFGLKHRQPMAMQELNQQLEGKQKQGFALESCQLGVDHTTDEVGRKLANLHYHALLKRQPP